MNKYNDSGLAKLGIVPIYYETLDDNVKIPEYAKEGDAGMDVCANEMIHIKPQETKIIPTGLMVEIPIGYELQIRPRSGLSYKTPLRIANSPATIDSGYRGEIGIIISNTSEQNESISNIYKLSDKGNKKGTYIIEKYDRVAQIVLAKCEFMIFRKGMITSSQRGKKGFGSTGV